MFLCDSLSQIVCSLATCVLAQIPSLRHSFAVPLCLVEFSDMFSILCWQLNSLLERILTACVCQGKTPHAQPKQRARHDKKLEPKSSEDWRVKSRQRVQESGMRQNQVPPNHRVQVRWVFGLLVSERARPNTSSPRPTNPDVRGRRPPMPRSRPPTKPRSRPASRGAEPSRSRPGGVRSIGQDRRRGLRLDTRIRSNEPEECTHCINAPDLCWFVWRTRRVLHACKGALVARTLSGLKKKLSWSQLQWWTPRPLFKGLKSFSHR